VTSVLAAAVLGAAFPRFARWMQWRTGLGVRRRVASAVSHALLIFAAKELVRRLREDNEASIAEAGARLGREPTDEDVIEQYWRRSLRHEIAREPTDQEVEQFRARTDAA
jgi:hypothetical protein